MKKIFTFFAVALFSMSSFAELQYAAPAETWTVGDVATLATGKWNSVTTNRYAVINNDWYMLSCYDVYKAKPEVVKWYNCTNSGGTSTATWSANGIFQGEAYYEAQPDGKTLCTRADRIYSYKVTNMSAFSVYCNAKVEGQKIIVEVYDGETVVATSETTTAADTIMTIGGLDKEKTYIVAIGGTGDKSGSQNSLLYEIAFSISGEAPVIVAKAVAPIFSKASGEYYDPFKVELTSSKADHIYYSLDGETYIEYEDSIEIKEYDQVYVIYAYATLIEAENSDTVKAEYTLTHFTPRPVFEARQTINLFGITADEIQILSGKNATIGTYTMDGNEIPSVNYLKNLIAHDGQDSAMSVTVTGREALTFRYKNTQGDKSNILKFAADYVQADGANVEMWIDGVRSKDTIVFVVTAKGDAPTFNHTYSAASYLTPYQPDDDEDPCYTDGAVYSKSDAKVKDDYVGWTDLVYIVMEGHTKVRLKETKKGFRIAKIQIGAYRGEAPSEEGIEELMAAPKATKVVYNGQVVIVKGGRMFNVLGAEIQK